MTTQNTDSTNDPVGEVQETVTPPSDTSTPPQDIPEVSNSTGTVEAVQGEYDTYKTSTNAAISKLRLDIAGHENTINKLTTQNADLTKSSADYESTKIQLTSVTAERNALNERLVEGAVSRLKGAGVDETKLADQSLSSLEAMLSAVEDVQKASPTPTGLGLSGGRAVAEPVSKTALEQAHTEMEVLVSRQSKNGTTNITQ